MKCGVLLGIVVSIPLFAAEKEVCPWINPATAAGILDGAVDMTTAAPSACEFVRQKLPSDTLRIDVGTRLSIAGKCASDVRPLKAIGNEAIACAEDARDGQRIERVVGRVRDQHFIVRVSTGDRSLSQDSLLEKARRAAEQVAGNLF